MDLEMISRTIFYIVAPRNSLAHDLNPGELIIVVPARGDENYRPLIDAGPTSLAVMQVTDFDLVIKSPRKLSHGNLSYNT